MNQPTHQPLALCVIIPLYNHHRMIVRLVALIREHNLPVLVINDGSNEETRQVLAGLAGQEGVTVMHLPTNQGKGAACQHGLRLAASQGYTHALQIDADGQHHAEDIPRFVAAATAHPAALVLGKPRFDRSVPLGRFLGRYLTHVWVWIETLSLAMKDTMCGFRVYPLAATMALLARWPAGLGRRMEFDTEIAVRLYWEGVPVINLETPVTYPADSLSHFQPFRDNVRISWLHTRLFFGMLWRLPRLLPRRSQVIPYPPDSWFSLGERGTLLGMRFVLWVYCILGARICSVLMMFLASYYWLVGRQIRRYSREYFAQLCQTPEGAAALGHAPGWRDSYRQFREFGETVVDKFGAWKNDLARHHLEWANAKLLDDHHRRGEGYILLSAHIGNVEAMRAVGETLGLARVNVFMLVDNARKVNRLLAEVNRSVSLRMIVAEHLGPETAIALRERLAAGEVVALMGDRMTPSTQGRVFRIPFLGRMASIPHGPFILASLLDSPVYVIFVTRLGFRHYQVQLEPLAATLAFPRAQRMAQLEQAARRYVTMLEAQCRRTPHQWFNFYDFWQS